MAIETPDVAVKRPARLSAPVPATKSVPELPMLVMMLVFASSVPESVNAESVSVL